MYDFGRFGPRSTLDRSKSTELHVCSTIMKPKKDSNRWGAISCTLRASAEPPGGGLTILAPQSSRVEDGNLTLCSFLFSNDGRGRDAGVGFRTGGRGGGVMGV